jgi:hypothetical protein
MSYDTMAAEQDGRKEVLEKVRFALEAQYNSVKSDYLRGWAVHDGLELRGALGALGALKTKIDEIAKQYGLQ